jgi:hypothetical protein
MVSIGESVLEGSTSQNTTRAFQNVKEFPYTLGSIPIKFIIVVIM